MKRAVFLDRDGVLNEAVVRNGRPHPPATLADLRPFADAAQAVADLRDAGFLAIAVTNQPDVARGTARRDEVEAINAAVAERLGIDAVYTCFHDDTDGCECRKPKPGLVLRAAHEHGVDVARSYLIGDRVKDVQCGRAAGCAPIFIDRGYAETPHETGADATAVSLAEAVRHILDTERRAPPRIKIFADGASLDEIRRLNGNPAIEGFTTNPTLMRRAGVDDVARFARTVLEVIGERPVSFEVLAEDFAGMERQARTIASWGANVYVKIPVTDTGGRSSARTIARLAGDGVKVNVTAVMTLDQVRAVGEALCDATPAFVSVFAGRVADTGRDPVPLMRSALAALRARPNAALIWASAREVLNVAQAASAGVPIITLTSGLLAKLPLLGKDLASLSLETVRMFCKDAAEAKLRI